MREMMYERDFEVGDRVMIYMDDAQGRVLLIVDHDVTVEFDDGEICEVGDHELQRIDPE